MGENWVKVWVEEGLNGSIRFELDSAERGLWWDLIMLAKSCYRMNQTRFGMIAANDTTPYPHSIIASRLNISLDFLNACLIKFEEQKRIHENDSGIMILNFNKYQGEGARQQRYRDKKKGERDYTSGKYGGMVQR